MAVARPTRRGVLAKLARVVGIRRRVVVDGVRYTERTTAREGRGGRGERAAAWEVRFPSGEAMLIHPGAGRVFSDLSPAAPLPPHHLLADRVRPGQRVLDVSCGTGAGAGLLLEFVGPSGAVVAMGDDAESVDYARRRYPGSNAAFEVVDRSAGLAPLEGEVEGAFDAVVAVRGVLEETRKGGGPGRLSEDRLAELWRVVSPGGLLLVELTEGPEPSAGSLAVIESVCEERAVRVSSAGDAHAAVLVTRPEAIEPDLDDLRGPDGENEEDEPRDDEWRFTG